MSQSECIFCKIVSGETPSEAMHEDETCIAFADLSPQAPVHILVVPRAHIESLDKATEDDAAVLGHLLTTAADLARTAKIAENGYRTVINTNRDGGQTIFHLHVHVMGGRAFTFPPG